MNGLEELASRHEGEDGHGRQVAALAVGLFDATHGLFGLPASERPVLEAAARLHDLGYGRDPRRHAQVGSRIAAREELAGFDRNARARVAMLIRLHSPRLPLEAARAALRRQPEAGVLLSLEGLLRIADALDYGHVQDAALAYARAGRRGIRIGVRCPHFPGALEVARRQAALWREAFPADLDLRLAAGRGRAAPLLEPTLPVEEAARRLLFLHYRTMLLQVEGALDPVDPEALHDLRVAIRRMRTVLRAFRKPLGPTSASRIEADLQRLNRVLGAARDLDVWIGFFSEEATARRITGHRLWKRFIDHQLELRRLQQATVRRHLRGATFSSLRLRIEHLLRIELPQLARTAPFRPLQGRARRAMARELGRARELGSLRQSRSPDKVHRLRIALRRVRYLGAAFGGILGPAVRKAARRAHAVERALGRLRDADLALDRIVSEGPAPPRPLIRHLERLGGLEASRVERLWSRFVDPGLVLAVRRQLQD